MKKTVLQLIAILVSSVYCSGQEKQFIYNGNPLVRDIYTADPSAHVWTVDGEERLYVYPSRDMYPAFGCDMMDRYHVYSTADMVNWTDHGEILKAADVPWGVPITNGHEGATFMWAPDCMYRDGVYYYYFPHPYGPTWNDTWRTGIATSANPGGPFTVMDTTLLGLPKNGHIDPCVFIDDDGQAYFYYGGGGSCYGAKLKDNMIELDGALKQMTGLSDFHEGTWVFRKGNNYYLCYADGNSTGGNQLRYAMSTSPLGPWQYKGVYLRPTGCDTSHGSVVEFKGEWWAFYHNQALSGAGNLRSICFDKLYFTADGRIQEVKQTKDMGTPPDGTPWTVPGTIEAENYNEGLAGLVYSKNLQTDFNVKGDVFLTQTGSGMFVNYTFNVTEAGVYDIDFIVANTIRSTTAQFYIEFDQAKTVNPVKYSVDYTGSTRWATITASKINLSAGVHVMTFYPLSDLNFDKCTFRFLRVGIPEVKQELVSVYPNPTSGVFQIEMSGSGSSRISDVSGKTIWKENMTSGSHTIDISAQAQGIYILSLQTKNGVYQQKIIKQ